MFGRTAPLLHVHDFHVQHRPELHLDPAEALHGRDRQAAAAAAAAAAPDQPPPIAGERSRHASLSGVSRTRRVEEAARSGCPLCLPRCLSRGDSRTPGASGGRCAREGAGRNPRWFGASRGNLGGTRWDGLHADVLEAT